MSAPAVVLVFLLMLVLFHAPAPETPVGEVGLVVAWIAAAIVFIRHRVKYGEWL